MKITLITRAMSAALLTLAVALLAYGIFGLSHFAMYTGEYFDERLVLFDNGVYPFIWGIALLIGSQLARLRYHRSAMLIAIIPTLAFLIFMRASIPPAVAGQSIFPGTGLLDHLIAISAAVLFLALIDRLILRISNFIF